MFWVYQMPIVFLKYHIISAINYLKGIVITDVNNNIAKKMLKMPRKSFNFSSTHSINIQN